MRQEDVVGKGGVACNRNNNYYDHDHDHDHEYEYDSRLTTCDVLLACYLVTCYLLLLPPLLPTTYELWLPATKHCPTFWNARSEAGTLPSLQ